MKTANPVFTEMATNIVQYVFQKVNIFLNVYNDNDQTLFFNALTFAWPRGHKTFFMLNSTEHEIPTAHKN